MSSTSDKVKGMANEVVGKVKQAVGKATGNTELEVKGKVQEKKGEA
ncbi:general stress protein CsbD [Pseudomonas sp. TJI-51]|nr:CsbD family protein [Pseudomonas sp. TJI-51]EGB95997.1 general stress protein CsbD [Pseudomonas sp. TJI-51]